MVCVRHTGAPGKNTGIMNKGSAVGKITLPKLCNAPQRTQRKLWPVCVILVLFPFPFHHWTRVTEIYDFGEEMYHTPLFLVLVPEKDTSRSFNVVLVDEYFWCFFFDFSLSVYFIFKVL